jgi:autotransporter-associated beta strand protein
LVATNYEFVGYSGTGLFNQSAGSNSVSGGVYSELIIGYNSGSIGTYNLNGTGHLTAESEVVGYSGTGYFTQTAGIHMVAGDLEIGEQSSGQGTYNLGGSGQLTAFTELIGSYGEGIFLHSSGTNTIEMALALGGVDGADSLHGHGTYLMSDMAELQVNAVAIGVWGHGEFIQTGGNQFIWGGVIPFKPEIAGGLYIGSTNSGVGTLKLSGGTLTIESQAGDGLYLAPAGTATVELTGGILTLPKIKMGTGTATFNFGGGTLKANASFETSIPMTLTGINGDAIIDTNTFDMILAGSISGDGGLIKNGEGLLAIAGPLSYSGTTTINVGTLEINNGLTNTLSTISGSGTLKIGGATTLNATSIRVDTLEIGTADAKAVPEPSALALLGMGIISLIFAWRRRRSRS